MYHTFRKKHDNLKHTYSRSAVKEAVCQQVILKGQIYSREEIP